MLVDKSIEQFFFVRFSQLEINLDFKALSSDAIFVRVLSRRYVVSFDGGITVTHHNDNTDEL